MSFYQIFQKLYVHYGEQGWWPGDSPFEVMVGAVLTQNTAWINVERAIEKLKENNALSPRVILETDVDIIADWLRPSGYFNIKAKRLRNLCHWLLDQGGEAALADMDTLSLRRALLDVNGIGPETADDILLYAFDRPVFVIDAYTRRLFSRLGMVSGEEHYELLRQCFEENLGLDVRLFNEYHALIVIHAKDRCRKKSPLCSECCLQSSCGFEKQN